MHRGGQRDIDTPWGGKGSDSQYGGSGNDSLHAGGYVDVVTGGEGADSFYFAATVAQGRNVDVIIDFESGIDSLNLDDDVFTTLCKGPLALGQFASGVDITTAQYADERIVYDTTTGTLYYDADGVGGTAAVAFAVLSHHAAITAADFVVVA